MAGAKWIMIGVVIIPPEYKDIEEHIFNGVDKGDLVEKAKLVNEIGIAAAVKVFSFPRLPLHHNSDLIIIEQTMVYTDAMDEELRAPPEDVEKELCNNCYDTIWNLGNVSQSWSSASFQGLKAFANLFTNRLWGGLNF